MAVPAAFSSASTSKTEFEFGRILDEFKADLSPHEVNDFSFTTATDLRRAIMDLQRAQMSEKRMRNLSRLDAFLEAMEQYDKVIQVFLNTTNFLCFVWGPAKFMLLAAASHADALNVLLEAYQEIGEYMPLLMQYEKLMIGNAYLHQILSLIYKDILEFHRKAMKHFRQRVWKQLFHATWKTFRTDFGTILSNLKSHRRLLENQAILTGVQETTNAIKELRHSRDILEQETQKRQEEEAKQRQRAVTAWLNAANSLSDHEDMVEAHDAFPSTGKWLLVQDSIQSWTDFSAFAAPLLWVYGKPGSGKTILASTLIEECRKKSTTGIVFFYCKHEDPSRNNFIAFARSILLQCCCLNTQLVPLILERSLESKTNILQSAKLAKELLGVAVESFGQLCMVIDGLDECPRAATREIVTWIRNLCNNGGNDNSGKFRCCFFSQDDHDIGQLLKGFPSYEILAKENKADIVHYCDIRTKEISDTFGLSGDDTRSIVDHVSEKADGMFLYAKLVMENLATQISKAALKKEIKTIPPNLSLLYNRIKRRILEESAPAEQRLAKTLLSWLLCMKRPLKWHEIQGAMCFDLDDDSFDEERRLVRGIKHFCGSLVEVRHGSVIDFVHLSVKFFLMEDAEIPRHIEQLSFTCLCFSYLTMDSHDSTLSEDSIKTFVLQGHYSFTEYALVHLFDHLREVCLARESIARSEFNKLCAIVKKFLFKRKLLDEERRPSKKAFDKSFAIFKNEDFFDDLIQAAGHHHQQRNKPLERSDDNVESMCLVTHIVHVRSVIESMAGISCLNPRITEYYGVNLFKCLKLDCEFYHLGFSIRQHRENHTSLHRPAFFCTSPGCPLSMMGVATVADLHKHEQEYHGEATDSESFPWHGTLESIKIHDEIRNGNYTAFNMWLSQFNDSFPLEIEKAYGSNHTPLEAACRHGKLEMVNKLFEKAPAKSLFKYHMLDCANAALESCHDEILRVVLHHYNRQDFVERDIYNMLERVLSKGLDASAITLLELPLSPFKESRYFTSQRRATYQTLIIRYGRQTVFRHLVENCAANPLQEDGKNRHSLIVAARYRQIGIAKYLVHERRVDKWRKNKSDDLALHVAGREGAEDFITSIYSEDEQGVDVWLKTARFRNSVCKGDKNAVERFLEGGGLHIDEVDSQSATPWLWAISRGFIGIVELLLARNDIDHRRVLPKDFSALHLAAACGYEKIVKMLLDSGVLNDKISVRAFQRHRFENKRFIRGTPLELATRGLHGSTARVIEAFLAQSSQNIP